MTRDYLKAGYPGMLLLTREPHRAENDLITVGWQFYSWDRLQGIRQAGKPQVVEEIRDQVETLNWLGNYQDTMLRDRLPLSHGRVSGLYDFERRKCLTWLGPTGMKEQLTAIKASQ
jgi:hypothetical protein